MTSSRRLRWSDVWLLMSIKLASSRRAAPIAHVLAASDLYNHATLGYEELTSGLHRLTRAGLVVQPAEPLEFRCAPGVRARLRRIGAKAKTAYDEWKAVELALEAVAWVPGEPWPHPANHHAHPGLTREIFDEALADYLRPPHQRRATHAKRAKPKPAKAKRAKPKRSVAAHPRASRTPR